MYLCGLKRDQILLTTCKPCNLTLYRRSCQQAVSAREGYALLHRVCCLPFTPHLLHRQVLHRQQTIIQNKDSPQALISNKSFFERIVQGKDSLEATHLPRKRHVISLDANTEQGWTPKSSKFAQGKAGTHATDTLPVITHQLP